MLRSHYVGETVKDRCCTKNSTWAKIENFFLLFYVQSDCLTFHWHSALLPQLLYLNGLLYQPLFQGLFPLPPLSLGERGSREIERYPGNEAVVVWFTVLHSLTFLWQLVKLWRASHFHMYIFFKKSRNRLFISSLDLSLFVLFVQGYELLSKGDFFAVIWKRAERVSTWEFCQMRDANNTTPHAPRYKFAAKVPAAASKHTNNTVSVEPRVITFVSKYILVHILRLW